MSSKREEERNEKIIRGLMKLPPNRRCINCNSLGPQYVCTNFWTFVCMTCSGIHREFTHRVKSVSMSKFTSQEVDSLQKGGNQRARELYMKNWDPQTHKFPDNSKADKVREFIKNVYENKKYALENSSERPPRDPQGLRNHEDETRRASSYHSYSQSPPYDFQYEERRYGKQTPTLSRKPGSDRGQYEGKLSGFFSPSRFIDRANDESFTNDGSLPRASDCSISSRGDPLRSGVISPTSVRETGSPVSEISRDILSEVPQHRTPLHNPEINYQNNGAVSHPQGNASLESFGTFDSNTASFKSVNSIPMVDSKPEPYAEISHDKSSSFSSVMQSSSAGTNNGVDLFGAPFATQNSTSTFSTSSNSLGSSSLTVDLFQQYPVSSVSVFTEQQPSHIQQTSSLDLFSAQAKQQSATSSHGKTSDEVMPNNGGWATFDMAQKFVALGSESSTPATVPSSGANISGNFNPFSLDQGSYSAVHEHASSSHTSWHEGLQNAVTANPPIWNAFEDSTAQKPIQNVAKINNDQAVKHCASDANMSHGYGVYYEVLNTDAIVRSQGESQPSYSSLSSHVSMAMHDFSIIPVAGVNSLATNHVPSNNPFDLPYDSDMGSGNMLWDMSSLQATLPNAQPPVSYVSDINQSWFTHNPIPSYVPGGVIYDHPTGSLGLIAGQTPNAQISSIPAQGPVASVGGNPFA